MEPSSFCTICTSQTIKEFIGWIITLSLHHRNAIVFILCDDATKIAYDNMTPRINLDIRWSINLNKYSNMDRDTMTNKNIWAEFQMCKADIIEIALNIVSDTLFMDCDTFILNKINDIDMTKQLGVSNQYIQHKYELLYGKYNGGLLWTNQKQLPEDWRLFTKKSRYFDQASIEDLVNKYQYFEFTDNYNIQSWRFQIGILSREQHINLIKIKNNKIYYNDRELKFLHTHFNSTEHKEFNNFFINLFKKESMFRELMIVYRVINNSWVIRIPEQPMSDIWYHKNDSFRELATLLEENNKDVRIKYDKTIGNCILEPNIILYDRPTLEWVNNQFNESSLILLGNGSINKEGNVLMEKKYRVSPWIFWGRCPRELDKIFENNFTYKERLINSIFIGNIENSIQEKFRSNKNWSEVIDHYIITSGTDHKYTQIEYLEQIKNARYGLCLRGYGSKCHREVELMACGTVPLITPSVSISYADPLIEGIHFLRINSPDDIYTLINTISEENWKKMSDACRAWYWKNVHSINCWNSTLQYIFYGSCTNE